MTALPNARRAGVLAYNSTMSSKLYSRALGVAMTATQSKKVFGFDTGHREKIAPSRVVERTRTVSEQREKTKAAATKVIRTHRKVLIALRDK